LGSYVGTQNSVLTPDVVLPVTPDSCNQFSFVFGWLKEEHLKHVPPLNKDALNGKVL
jgi:hypothetical protein